MISSRAEADAVLSRIKYAYLNLGLSELSVSHPELFNNAEREEIPNGSN